MSFNSKNKYAKKEDTEYNDYKKDYLNIWEVNPTFKEIKSSIISYKWISLILLILFYIYTTFNLGLPIISSILSGIIVLLIILQIFNDRIFSLKNFASFHIYRLSQINPFSNLMFFFLNEKKTTTLFYYNKLENSIVALRIFKVLVVPENVHHSLNHFIRILNTQKIWFTYQIVQKPISKNLGLHNNIEQSGIRKSIIVNSDKSFTTEIYFCIYDFIKGKINKKNLEHLNSVLEILNDALKAAFNADFSHYKISLLSGTELIEAIRLNLVKLKGNDKIDSIDNYESFHDQRYFNGQYIFQLIFIIFIFIYLAIFIIITEISELIIILIMILINLLFSIIWGKHLIFLSLISRDFNKNRIKLINPFKGIDFYIQKDFPNSLFIHINRCYIMDLQFYNLKYSLNPQFSQSKKFFRALIAHQIPFAYTFICSPLTFYEFFNLGLQYLNEKWKESVSKLDNEREGEKWLNYRAGIWRTIGLFSISSQKNAKNINKEILEYLEKETNIKANFLINSLRAGFPDFNIEPLKNNKMLSGLLISTLKNKFFSLEGTYLNYLLFQGEVLLNFINISDELKRGLNVKIAAEFNSPLHLENLITIGRTINTENLELEIPAGFTLEQLKNLLIVSGKNSAWNILLEKIVAELILAEVPSIIFDYDGTYAKLIKYFENTRYEKNILYFKLGYTFNIDVQLSDIPYDVNNVDYLNYFFDAYAMAFRVDSRKTEAFKNTLLKYPGLDLSSIALDLENKNIWEKSYNTDSIISFIKDFTQNTIVFSGTQENKAIGVKSIEFIQNNKTIIVDLSILKELEHKIFITFIIISKIIHYTNQFEDYVNKILIIPNVDLYFNTDYLERTLSYGKINKFLEPLLGKDFGLIMMANQIRYLHPNIFNYFNNYITFKTVDKRDITILKNIMKLQELQGTGLYSNKRNNTYQIDYLMGMKNDEIIVKRSDINQPFPVKIESEIISIQPPSKEYLNKYMKKLGYDNELTEKQLIQQAKETLFKKDLGIYYEYIPEIIKFLGAISKIDKIGNLYKHKLKEQLLKLIYPKASKNFNDKRKIRKIRDKIFDLLLKHEYLIEAHPKKASGSESMNTSYMVSKKFSKALEEYYNSVKNDDIIDVGIIKQESYSNLIEDIFYKKENKINIIDNLQFKNDLANKTGRILLKNLFHIERLIKEGKYQQAIEIEKETLKKFISVWSQKVLEFDSKNNVSIPNLDASINILSQSKYFPFNREELISLLRKCSIGDDKDKKELEIDDTNKNLNFIDESRLKKRAEELNKELTKIHFKVLEKLMEG